MKHLKKYENWFTDLFKSKEYDYPEQFIINTMEREFGHTYLMSAADEGDFKKFQHYFPEYIDRKNLKDNDTLTTLMHVATGKGSIEDKKKMLKMLLDNGEDPFMKYNGKSEKDKGKTFYDFLNSELKKWVNDNYPQFEFDLKQDVKNYNL